jgi:superfamily II DNA or RNA helicase
MCAVPNERELNASEPENIFIELFAQAFGLDKVQLLRHDLSVDDIYGQERFIDYALKTPHEQVAFEIDGLTWHLPQAMPVQDYEDHLLRQNSLIHQGWRVFRWSDREIREQPERVKQELELFLERIPGIFSFDDFLPKQGGAVVELRLHQQEALDSLAAMRASGKTIALLADAQGTGKTIAAIADAKRLGGRTLFVAHRRELVEQAYNTLKMLWPEASIGLYMADKRDREEHNVVASIQSLADNLADFNPEQFQYLVIDEAHHAAAKTYRRVLGYFTPGFVLGLTATPERADNQSLLEIFRDCAHRLGLREAVERGELVPIRCVRVETNVDLSHVRFNQVQYNRRDIEDTVIVPARDQLIVDAYKSHVSGRKAVAFCVNVRHGEAMAKLFCNCGVPARSVSGRMPRTERQACLDAFRKGEVSVLCACDILTEGWDCPDLEVLLMARPTLSQVVYLQQLGRGTRKAPGKDELIVFDFVDNATRYNQPLSLNRVVGERRYRPGGLLLAPQGLRDFEEEALRRGQDPITVLEIGVWAKDFQEIDVFNWQEKLRGMASIYELERVLGASEGSLRAAVERGAINPDESLMLGDREYHYFAREREDEIRGFLGLVKRDDANIANDFFKFAEAMDMATSYKPVFLIVLLDSVDDKGRASVATVASKFRAFYQARREAALVIERPGAALASVGEIDDASVRRIMLRMPFEKFERRGFLRYARDVAFIEFAPALWRRLGTEELAKLRSKSDQSIASYYAGVNDRHAT